MFKDRFAGTSAGGERRPSSDTLFLLQSLNRAVVDDFSLFHRTAAAVHDLPTLTCDVHEHDPFHQLGRVLAADQIL